MQRGEKRNREQPPKLLQWPGRKGRGPVTGEGLGRKSLQEVLNEEVVVISQVPR